MGIMNMSTAKRLPKKLGNLFGNLFVKSAPAEYVANSMLAGGNVLPQDEANSASIAGDREWSEAQAQKQMDFQKMMSDTQWQRGVSDMQKAGLNPALAYMQGGASSASGASASTSSTEQNAVLQRERLLFQTLNNAISVMGRR